MKLISPQSRGHRTRPRFSAWRRPSVAALILALLAAAVQFGTAGAWRGGYPASGSSPSTLLAHMTLKQKIGQMLMVSFDGTSLSSQAISMLETFQPGGITLFGDNFSSTSQLKQLDGQLQKRSHVPMFISVDQEGGYVDRVTKGVKQLPSEQAYGQTDNPSQVKADTSVEASELHALGINMNLAPVLDVATPNSIIGSEARSYGPNASEDTALGLAAIHGYQSHGIAATAKHVVGLGTTETNPETTLPHLHLTSQQLSTQLSPFKAAAHAGVDGMMVTHVIIAGVTSPTTPASLSYNVVTKILRSQFGYKGVIMTDSLTMGAVTSRIGIGTACIMAVTAGEDILLIAQGGPNSQSIFTTAVNAVVGKVNSGKIPMSRINQSVLRILRLKQTLHLSLPAS